MNLHMIRAVRLVNAQQKGLPAVDFIAALDDSDVDDAFQELLRRRGGGARNAVSAVVDALSVADAVNYLTTGHAFAHYVAASSAAMSAIAASSTAMSSIAASSAAMEAVLSSSTALTAIFFVPAAKDALLSNTALAKASVPKMTSATTPSGIASASSSAGAGYLPWLVFDQAPGTFWNSAVVVGGTGNDWIQYSFPTDVFISSASLTPAASAIYAPKDCAIQYSSDGVTFSSAKSITAAATGVQSFEVMMPGFYKHWRLVMYSAQSGLNYLQLAELGFTGFVKPA